MQTDQLRRRRVSMSPVAAITNPIPDPSPQDFDDLEVVEEDALGESTPPLPDPVMLIVMAAVTDDLPSEARAVRTSAATWPLAGTKMPRPVEEST